MTTSKMNQLLELISDLVNENEGAWIDKRDALLACADGTKKINLEEFANWFMDADA